MKTKQTQKQKIICNSSISDDGFLINDSLLQIQLAVDHAAKDLRRIVDIGRKLDKIGGSLPYQVRAVFANVDPLSLEMNDAEFVESCEKIEQKNADPVQRALAFAAFAKRIQDEIVKVLHRSEKLTERIRAQKHGPEAETAKHLKHVANETVDVLNRRLGFVLDCFFKARNVSIAAILRVTNAVAGLFPDGSVIAREAALANMNGDIAQFKSLDDRLLFGVRSSKSKRVRI